MIAMEGRPLYIFTAAQIIAVVMVLWFVFSRPGPWNWQRSIGAALLVAGIAGIATARYQLGKSFAIQPAAHHLVTRGIYSKIRNPIYVFGLIAMAGLVLVLDRPILWLLVLAIAIMQALRAHAEAQVLEAAFGDAYRDYRRKTWF
jgi:protein-S-isoprenylcysteine O-methyltransferase Ste14